MSYSMLETERTNPSLDHDTDSLDNAQVAAAPIFAASSANNPSNNDDVSAAMDTISSGAHANSSPVQFAGAIDTLQSSLGNRATMDFMHQQDQADIHTIAQSGFRNSATAYPFQDQIQQAFGDKHDISGLSAYTGPAARSANAEFGSDAYHKGGNVAFGGEPTLHDAAHEAAHYVQNVGTTQLAGGVGSPGDMYERHADQVADGVLQGKDVSGLLDQSPGGDSQTPTNSAEAPVQMLGGKGSLFSRLSRIGPQSYRNTASMQTNHFRRYHKLVSGDRPFIASLEHPDEMRPQVFQKRKNLRDRLSSLMPPSNIDDFKKRMPQMTGKPWEESSIGKQILELEAFENSYSQHMDQKKQSGYSYGDFGMFENYIKSIHPDAFSYRDLFQGDKAKDRGFPERLLKYFQNPLAPERMDLIWPMLYGHSMDVMKDAKQENPNAQDVHVNFDGLSPERIAHLIEKGDVSQYDDMPQWEMSGKLGVTEWEFVRALEALGPSGVKIYSYFNSDKQYHEITLDFMPEQMPEVGSDARKELAENFRKMSPRYASSSDISPPESTSKSKIKEEPQSIESGITDNSQFQRTRSSRPWVRPSMDLGDKGTYPFKMPDEEQKVKNHSRYLDRRPGVYDMVPYSGGKQVSTIPPRQFPQGNRQFFQNHDDIMFFLDMLQNRVGQNQSSYHPFMDICDYPYGWWEAVMAHSRPEVLEENLARIQHQQDYKGIQAQPGFADFYRHLTINQHGQQCDFVHQSVSVSMGDKTLHNHLIPDFRQLVEKDELGNPILDKKGKPKRRDIIPKPTTGQYGLNPESGYAIGPPGGVGDSDFEFMNSIIEPYTGGPTKYSGSDPELAQYLGDTIQGSNPGIEKWPPLVRFSGIPLSNPLDALIYYELSRNARTGIYDVRDKACPQFSLGMLNMGGANMGEILPSSSGGDISASDPGKNVSSLNPGITRELDNYLAHNTTHHFDPTLLASLRDQNASVTDKEGNQLPLNFPNQLPISPFDLYVDFTKPWLLPKDAPWPWHGEIYQKYYKKWLESQNNGKD